MSMTNKTPYHQLGSRIQELRLARGLNSQGELAALLKTVKQQSISRWEKGASRPRQGDLELLAMAIEADLNELKVLAGYSSRPIANTSFDQPFPIDLLPPDIFERFCHHFLYLLHPTAKSVHRFGATGHKQDGIDLEVLLGDETYTYQCKRREEFGPAQVKKAVEEHNREAQKNVLLLTRIASPKSRDEIKKYVGWELWDKEDISLRIRLLAKVEQIRLVDIFFPGQRQALLGETEAGPWVNVDDFFEPFLADESIFNHKWQLIGREQELASLDSCLMDESIKAILITGSGGSGKSRLLYQALSAFLENKQDVMTKVLSIGEELTSKHLESLGVGRKLLVVDDAHDREDLPILFKYVANPKNQAKLVLSLRSYGYERISLHAANVSLQPPHAIRIDLKSLTLKESVLLAQEVLHGSSGPIETAEQIAKFTLDCPLATVLGAQIVSREKIKPEFLNIESTFRTTILAKFQDVITYGLANESGRDKDRLDCILRILALVQPFNPSDSQLLELIEKIEDISIADSNKYIGMLIKGGILFKRGQKYRLAPDLLADYIIEQSCVKVNGASTGYAEKVFSEAPAALIEHILMNLGKLDWRRTSGDTSNSGLLNDMWRMLDPSGEYGDLHLRAMISVAYYQPERALRFAEECIRDGREIRDLPELIKYAAYNFEFVERACACLWELGSNDARKINQHPQHSIRILKELCSVEPNKPVEYNQKIVNFFISLLDDPNAWAGSYTPYDVLQGILQTEGHTTSSNGREISFGPFQVKQAAVKELRQLVIGAAISRLNHSNIKIAIYSAAALHHALRYPMGQFGSQVSDEEYGQWTKEFVDTLKNIKDKVANSEINSLVWLELQNAISWHSRYSKTKTKLAAKKIMELVPSTIDYRLTRSLMDGYGRMLEDYDVKKYQEIIQKTVKAVSNELISLFPEAEQLHLLIEEKLREINENKPNQVVAPHHLISECIAGMPKLGLIIINSGLKDPTLKTAEFIDIALTHAYKTNIDEGRSLLLQLFNSTHVNLRRGVANAIGEILCSNNLPMEEMNVLHKLLNSDDQLEVLIALRAIRQVAQINPEEAKNLILSTNFSNSVKIADEVCTLFHENGSLPASKLDEVFVMKFLEKILTLPNISEFWLEHFLSVCSEQYPRETLSFFMRRVEYAQLTQNYSFRPCNYGPYVHTPLKFRLSAECDYLMRALWRWSRENYEKDAKFEYFASHVFLPIFSPIDDSVISFLREKLNGDELDIQLIGKLLRDAPSNFSIANYSFIVDFLTVAKSFGKKTLDQVTNELYCSAVSGLKQGIAGVPFARDIEVRDLSKKMLENLPQFSPAYSLYSLINKDAERNISDSFREAESYGE